MKTIYGVILFEGFYDSSSIDLIDLTEGYVEMNKSCIGFND